MKSLKGNKKLALRVDALTVDTFPTMAEMEIPNFAAASISLCTRCPSHIDSVCPCCTSPEQC